MLNEIFAPSISGITVIEEDIGAVSMLLAKQVGSYAVSLGKKVCYVSLADGQTMRNKELVGVLTAPTGEELQQSFLERNSVTINVKPSSLVVENLSYDLVVFESFSNLVFTKSERDIVELFSEMKKLVPLGRNFVLVVETPLLSSKINGYIRSMSDNVIMIRTEIIGDKVTRLLFVPKMKDVEPMDRLIKFTIEDDQLQVDTREFVG